MLLPPPPWRWAVAARGDASRAVARISALVVIGLIFIIALIVIALIVENLLRLRSMAQISGQIV
jgi:hypothetical protein